MLARLGLVCAVECSCFVDYLRWKVYIDDTLVGIAHLLHILIVGYWNFFFVFFFGLVGKGNPWFVFFYAMRIDLLRHVFQILPRKRGIFSERKKWYS